MVLSAAAPEGHRPSTVRLAIRLERHAELVRESGEDDVVRVGAEAECLCLDCRLELLGHAQEHDRARAGQWAAPVRRCHLDAECVGEDADRDVVEARSATGRLADESLLQGGGSPNQDALALRSASSQTAISIASLRSSVYPLLALVYRRAYSACPAANECEGVRLGFCGELAQLPPHEEDPLDHGDPRHGREEVDG